MVQCAHCASAPYLLVVEHDKAYVQLVLSLYYHLAGMESSKFAAHLKIKNLINHSRTDSLQKFFFFGFSCIFILLSRESDQSATTSSL